MLDDCRKNRNEPGESIVCWRDNVGCGVVTLFWRNHGSEIFRLAFCDLVGSSPWKPSLILYWYIYNRREAQDVLWVVWVIWWVARTRRRKTISGLWNYFNVHFGMQCLLIIKAAMHDIITLSLSLNSPYIMYIVKCVWYSSSWLMKDNHSAEANDARRFTIWNCIPDGLHITAWNMVDYR